MWIYRLVVQVLRVIFKLTNGKIQVKDFSQGIDWNKRYLIVAPHRTTLDPVILAIALYPKTFRILAKKELFDLPLLGWALKKAQMIPINREKPERKSIKEAISELRKGSKSVVIYPTGTRWSTEIKPGAGFIAESGKVNLLPVAYQGPLHWKTVLNPFYRPSLKFGIGKVIDLDEIEGRGRDKVAKIDEKIAKAFEELDHEIDPTYVYDVEKEKTAYEKRTGKKISL